MKKDDKFLDFLKQKQSFNSDVIKVFGRNPEKGWSATVAEIENDLLEEIISRYEKFVKEQTKDVETLS